MTRLDIFADPVCPWCLIGQVELDRALAARPDHPFAITWHPFRLNPAIPRGGMDRVAHLRAVLGDEVPGRRGEQQDGEDAEDRAHHVAPGL